MKPYVFGFFTAVLLFALLFAFLHRLGRHPRHNAAGPSPLYREWVEKTAERAANPPPGSDEERRWVQKVEEAFSPFTPESAAENFPRAYAEELYFRDAFHSYTDRTALTDYMVKSAEMSPGVTFEFSPVVRNGIDFYLPWVMVLPSDTGESERSLGVSHLRFNEQGQVIFHQDYWDSADVLVPKVPVANGLIELVRRRF